MLKYKITGDRVSEGDKEEIKSGGVRGLVGQEDLLVIIKKKILRVTLEIYKP